jgi:hypothetical protein
MMLQSNGYGVTSGRGWHGFGDGGDILLSMLESNGFGVTE